MAESLESQFEQPLGLPLLLRYQAHNALIQTTYLVFRQIYSANSHNPRAMFAVSEYLYQADALGSVAHSAAQAGALARKLAEDEQLPDLLPDDLQKQYPRFAASLLNLLRTKKDGGAEDAE